MNRFRSCRFAILPACLTHCWKGFSRTNVTEHDGCQIEQKNDREAQGEEAPEEGFTSRQDRSETRTRDGRRNRGRGRRSRPDASGGAETEFQNERSRQCAGRHEVIGIVGEGYKVFTNDQAVTLCHKFCLEAFPDTKAAEWNFVDGHGPATRSWAAMDIHHQSHSMNLMGNGGPSELFTPFVRITNSYNGTRALRIESGRSFPMPVESDPDSAANSI